MTTKFMRFTIVTPSFNQLDWLELCIASVRDQVATKAETGNLSLSAGLAEAAPEFSIEHIVQDAGTPGIEDFARRMGADFYRDGEKVGRWEGGKVGGEGKVNECEGEKVGMWEGEGKVEKKGYSLTIYSEKDAGMYDAINKGLRRATGDICSYLNCDEQLLPGTLTTVAEYLAKHTEIDVVFGDSILVDAQGAALCYWRPYVPTLNHLAGATLNTLSCSTFFRGSMIEAGHLFEPQWKVIGDLQWIRGLLAKSRLMGCLHRPLATFTFLGDNLGASRIAKDEFEMTRTRRRGVRSIFRRGIHFVRKIVSGSYTRRKITYHIFSIDNPHRRNRYSHPSLGWAWPRSQP